MLKLAELDEHIPRFAQKSSGDHPPNRDQGITAPVQKPREARDHGFEIPAVDDILMQRGF